MELSDEWIVGFVDGEGCFFVGIQSHPEMTTGYQVLPEFIVVQHKRDIQVLYALKSYFGFGVVRRNHGDRYAYRVRGLDGLQRVSEFFMKHPLKTKKNVDFRKFRRILLLIQQGRHLNSDGLREIVTIAMQMNNQKRDALKKVLSDLDDSRTPDG